ncbi:MAG: aminodeoxychorismate lyase [Gammaproteobacteria bacterium]|nr:aminodeoxychorismate lyase [Gammaproteobacteria bacterium]
MILVNGKVQQQLHTDDRAIQFGDGLFETIAFKNNQLEYFTYHLDRLQRGCERLSIEMPTRDIIQSEIQQMTDTLSTSDAVIKVIVTRGKSSRGYQPLSGVQPTRIIKATPWPEYPKKNALEGIKLAVSSLVLSEQPLLAGIKHLNRLEQVLIAIERQQHSPIIDDMLVCDQHQNIIECQSSNIFIVDNEVLKTPNLQRCGIEGIMRQVILETAAELSIKTDILDIPLCTINHASEIFICNSLFGIWPVKQINQWLFQPGAITRQLQRALT